MVGLSDPELTARWLVARQTLALDDEELMETSDGDEPAAAKTPIDAPRAVKLHSLPSLIGEAGGADFLQWAGFNGRCNKVADTCYAWWVGGSLSVRSRAYLRPLVLSLIALVDAW